MRECPICRKPIGSDLLMCADHWAMPHLIKRHVWGAWRAWNREEAPLADLRKAQAVAVAHVRELVTPAVVDA